jgi:predicted ATPase/class 3 adenylate cyclase
MADPPTGTVTFLFTDIEGSTRLAQDLGSRWRRVLEKHQRLLRGAFSAKHGIERGTEGDSFFIVFTHASEAVAAAIDAQPALDAARWPAGVELRVRMGLHSGDAQLGGDGYVGLDIHRAARIAAAAHGGQVLLSDSTRSLVERELSPSIVIRDLGEHRLKDLDWPERLYQLEIPGRRNDFPPVRSIATTGHLPTETTSFVGRDREIRDVVDLLAAHRLVTLTGPGGVGKTRLSLRVAQAVTGDFADGAWFVPLSTVFDADQMPSALAVALGVRNPGGSPASAVREYARTRELLLILDNLEQVSGAHSVVGELLGEAPKLRIIATSRAPLRVGGEQEYLVPSLLAPDPDVPAGPDALRGSDAVSLFVQRASLVRPALRIDDEVLRDIAEIGRRVDGLPLAIELAAARSRLFSPGQILRGLGRRLDSLVAGPSDAPERQRSMRAAIAWSHDLLSATEQAVFRCLGVFVGEWDLDAAEAVVTAVGPATNAVGEIQGLIEQSLVRPVDSPAEPRFVMLDTIREYALERLEGAAEFEPARRAHAAHFAGLAERVGSLLRTLEAGTTVDRLERDIGNLRAALAWSLESGDADTGLRLAAALGGFWHQRGHMAEARRAIVELLDQSAASNSQAAARAIMTVGSMANWQGDYSAGRRYGERALAMFRERGDLAAIAAELAELGYATILDDPTEATRLLDECVAIYESLGDTTGAAGGRLGLAAAQLGLGDLVAARGSVERSLQQFREIRHRYYSAFALSLLGRIEMAGGDLGAAERLYRDGINDAVIARSTIGLSVNLWALGSVAIERGNAARGARLAGAAARLMEDVGGSMPGPVAGTTDVLARARSELGTADYEQAVSDGRRASIDEVIAEALTD